MLEQLPPQPADSKIRDQLTLSLPAANQGCIWVHACSVGETASMTPLIRRLLDDGQRVHLTVVTRTGYLHARRVLGEHVSLSYLPWDLPGLMRRLVKRLQPRLMLVAETEFWPGMLKACRNAGIPVISINTRISDRSFPRYHAMRLFWQRWLEPIRRFLAQSELDAERLAAIGVPQERIAVTGNLKFAVTRPDIDTTRLRLKLDTTASRPILLIASTHEPEETMILNMLGSWQQACPTLLPVIVPRHPQRFDQVAATISSQGFRLNRWSQNAQHHSPDIVLVDAMGVLAGLYAVADIVIIGGSLANIGGHNPLEAAICGRGAITGPYTQNFRAIMQDMSRHGAAIVARDATELEAIVTRMLRHPDELRAMHAHAATFMQETGDVLGHVWDELRPWLENRA